MSCPTCDHTMQGLGDLWCPRCGTAKSNERYATEAEAGVPSGGTAGS